MDNRPDWCRDTSAGIFRNLPAEKCYTDLGRALADNAADFAIVAVPPASHKRIVDVPQFLRGHLADCCA